MILLAGGIYYLGGPAAPNINGISALAGNTSGNVPGGTTSTEGQVSGSVNGGPGQNVSQYVVTYTDNGYTPASLSVPRGATVTFKNNSAGEFWPASAMHPSHAAYSGTVLSEHCPDANNSAFDACRRLAAGEGWDFKFDKTGTWRYHDHIQPQFTGTIIVQ